MKKHTAIPKQVKRKKRSPDLYDPSTSDKQPADASPQDEFEIAMTKR